MTDPAGQAGSLLELVDWQPTARLLSDLRHQLSWVALATLGWRSVDLWCSADTFPGTGASSEPGRGSVFCFTIPASPADPDTGQPAAVGRHAE